MLTLPNHISEKYAAARDSEDQRRAVFANLNNADLVASTRFWMQHCNAPKRFSADECVYDATVWHILIPELLRRLEQ